MSKMEQPRRRYLFGSLALGIYLGVTVYLLGWSRTVDVVYAGLFLLFAFVISLYALEG